MAVAGCGEIVDLFTVVDDLTGTPGGCRWGPGVEPAVILQPCTGFIYNKQCGSYQGGIVIIFSPAGQNFTPNTQAYLTTLGIGNVNYIRGSVNIYTNASRPVSKPISPSLFPNLRRVNGMVISGERIVRIGGLDQLQQVLSHPILLT